MPAVYLLFSGLFITFAMLSFASNLMVMKREDANRQARSQRSAKTSSATSKAAFSSQKSTITR